MGPMRKTGQGSSARWSKVIQSEDDYRDIMWTDLLNIARKNWEQVILDPSSLPVRDAKKNGYRNAPAWWAAVEKNSNVYCHAEDAVEHDFETALRAGDLSLPYVRVAESRSGRKFYDVQDRDNPHSNLKIAVWGCYGDESFEEQQKGHPIELCTQSRKRPGCQDVAKTLNIEYCTREKLQEERGVIAASNQSYGGAGRGHSDSGPSSSGRRSGPSGPPSNLPSSSMRPSGRGGRGADMSQLSGKMSSLDVSPPRRESARKERAGKEEYWTWDPKRREYYHMHRDGTVSVSRSGR
ncbi:uncharacterized protein B0H64DRAFT_477931 [Chaetomium fimeti]|uniref:Uncharacterized protein n=1 Tax=Chaetomium fimeti TaxID=1854472 RepID=A0AAE0LNM3_9PEZI|nr:hypothetical protein B0H64DRAFT_477931 [Chaetomium fimeti]